ncbi:MerR family transcriptional regulator [Paenibacillus sp. TY11]|uniref:MerR family transcriptional regulator n=1 Tax=Paenibacillus sp. TY11 TaxID=3448633 RepID=UPI0040399CF8
MFKPEYVNPDNRYRYYGVKQICDLDIIKYLKHLGTPLEEIRRIIKLPPESMCDFLDKQKLIIDEQIQKLNDTKKLLAHHKNQLQEQTRLHDQEFGVVYTRKLDERSVLKVIAKT